MSTSKTTTAGHALHIQKKRRAEFIEEWRKNRRSVIRQRRREARSPTARGMRSGVYMGADGDSPTRCLDALVHEIDPGTSPPSTATPGMRSSSSSRARAGARSTACATRWKPWDAIHIPAWSWHRHGNDGAQDCALHELFLGADALDARHVRASRIAVTSPVRSCRRRRPRAGPDGDDPYARRLPTSICRAEETQKRTYPHALRRAGPARHAARHAHQVPRRPGHRQRGLGHHPGDDPVRPGQDAVAAPASRAKPGSTSSRATATASWAPRPTAESTTAGRRAT